VASLDDDWWIGEVDEDTPRDADGTLLCPKCGRWCTRDEVDVQVGVLHGPWGCFCGWSQDAEYDLTTGPKFTENGGRIDQWGGVTPSGD
jgi:hypothetical protein